MPNQRPDDFPTMMLGATAATPPAGPSKPDGRNRLMLGALGGCLILLLLLACGGVAAWYYATQKPAAQLVPTRIVNTQPAPTRVPTVSPAATVAASAKPPTAGPTTTQAAAAAGVLAFASNGSGNYDIYVLDISKPDAVTDLTNNPATDSNPAWSPDGKRIAFDSDRSGSPQIYVMDAAGGNVTQLTHDKAQAIDPSWSPDGKQIAYATNLKGNLDIYVMNADGSNPQQSTVDPGDDFEPKWSPDGKQILFRSSRDNQSLKDTAEIYVKPATPGGALRLLPTVMNAQRINWSPGGTQVIFGAKPDVKGFFQIYLVNPDGSGQQQLTKTSTNESFPAFSPDGKKIAFVSDRTGKNNLFLMMADGSGQTQLTNASGDNITPAWRPQP